MDGLGPLARGAGRGAALAGRDAAGGRAGAVSAPRHDTGPQAGSAAARDGAVRPRRRRGARAAARRLAGGAVLALAVLSILGLIAEAGLRVAGRLTTGAWPETRLAAFHREVGEVAALYRRHPFLNAGPVAGARVHAFGKTASFNSLGYRSPERAAARPAGVLRVVCAGGSTTFDLLAASDVETWPWRLEAELRGRGLPVEVWNAGFPGWTSAENLISMALREVDLAPDLVLLYQGINDLQPGSHRPLDREYVRGHADQSRRALGLGLEPPGLLARSLVAERLRDALVGPEDPWRRLAVGTAGGARHPRLAAEAPGVFERNVRSFVAVAEAAGARVALATQVVRVRAARRDADLVYLAEWLPGLEPEAAPRELERLNDVLRRIASESSGVLLFDVAADLRWRDEDFADAIHLSPAGTGRLIAYLAAAVERAQRPPPAAAGAEGGAGAARR
jgi:lysophospholipase L1-like esterase